MNVIKQIKMKFFLITIFFTFNIYSKPTVDLLNEIEKKLKCSALYRDKGEDEIEKCIKKILEIEMTENDKSKVQLGVFSQKNNAYNLVKKYNNWKKINNLKNSKVEIKKDNGYFVVSVFQEGVNAKYLKRKITQEGWYKKTYISHPMKITIDIDNKLINKNNSEARIRILKAKSNCLSKYKKNKLTKTEFKNCLKKEAITVLQIHALPNKDFCKNTAKKYCKKIKQDYCKNKGNSLCEKAKKKCEARQCIEKKVGKETYYTIIETIDSQDKVSIKEIKQQKSKPFKLKKAEVLIK